jgi:hypothetical protein
MPNGGFECMTKLISIGDVIDTIRINNVTTDQIGSSVQQSAAADPNQTQAPKQDIKTQFELLMDLYCNIDDNNPRKNSPIITDIDAVIPESELKNIDTFIYKYKTGKGAYGLTEGNNQAMFESQFGGSLRQAQEGIELSAESEITLPLKEEVAPVSEYAPGDMRRRYYMQFAYFLHILNILKNIFAEKNQTLVTIEIPGTPSEKYKASNGLCQASYNSISVDPNVALIRNSKATLFTSVGDVKGFLPEVYKTEYLMTKKGEMEEYLYENTNFGLIKNVYLNIGCIVDTYKKQSAANNGNVYLGELIDELLTKISFSLGSINDFGKVVLNNKAIVIDKHYTELTSDSLYDSKFKINISGNNSIVRQHKIQSKIFPSQATMMAIAAQDRENVASLQSSTYNYLNKGLKDRLFISSTDSKSEKDKKEDSVQYYRNLYENIISLIFYVNSYVIPNQSINPQYYLSNVNAMNTYLNTLLVQIERGTDYKAVVPISVEMTIDGLSGFTIGQIFTVNKDVLPKDYESKSVGFIVTGISNEVNTHSWTTTIASQMCLLDQDKRQEQSLRNSQAVMGAVEEAIGSKKAQNNTACIYFNILAAITMDCLLNRYQIESPSGVVKIRNASDPLYTKAAIQEFANGLFDFNYVLKEINSAYLKAFPNPKKAKFYDNFYYRSDDLNNPVILAKVISQISLYEGMSSVSSEAVKVFNDEFYKVITGINTYVVNPDPTISISRASSLKKIVWYPVFTKFFNGVENFWKVVTLERNPFDEENILNSREFIYKSAELRNLNISIIDVKKAIDSNTGLFRGPVSSFLVSGYQYTTPSF